jgi:hypothetical protein
MRSCVACWFFLAFATAAWGAAPAPQEIAASVLQPRREMHRGKVVLEVYDRTKPVDNAEEFLLMRATVWFDGDALRVDATRNAPVGSAADSGLKSRFTQEVIAAGTHIDRFVDPNSPPLAVRLEREDSVDLSGTHLFHPNVLGIEPSPTLQKHALDKLRLNLHSSTEATVEEQLLDGVPCWALRQKFPSGASQTTWIRQQSPTVVRCTFEAVAGSKGMEKSVVDSITCQGSAPGANVPWFPEQIDYTRSVDGVVRISHRTRILDASFDDSVDPALFTVAGMGLPPGTQVLEFPGSVGHTWNGQTLERHGAGEIPEEVPLAAATGARWWVIVGINLTLLSIVCLLLYYRSRARDRVR